VQCWIKKDEMEFWQIANASVRVCKRTWVDPGNRSRAILEESKSQYEFPKQAESRFRGIIGLV
jgi:hypothetical protein